MASPTFLHELAEEQLNKLSQEDIRQICRAEQLYWDNKPYTAYRAVSHGSKTKNGGLIRAFTASFKVKGISFAVVGDEAIYVDGTTAKIISGAGEALTLYGHSAALVGSRLDNGDEIIDSTNAALVFRLYHDQLPPKGFLNQDLKGAN